VILEFEAGGVSQSPVLSSDKDLLVGVHCVCVKTVHRRGLERRVLEKV
jgi:hypothetical protein